MKKKELILQKIWLPGFIDVLIEMYDRGADFVDLQGVPGVEQDEIKIIVREDYLCSDEEMGDDEMTKEKLNDLLNG